METLLAILLYMQVIQSPGIYSQAHINQLHTQYHQEILNIQNDPDQMHEVNSVYMPQVNNIIVIGEAEVSTKKILCDFAYLKDNKTNALPQ